MKKLAAFLWRERLWWMAPILLAVILIALLVVFAAQPVAAPFIYTLF